MKLYFFLAFLIVFLLSRDQDMTINGLDISGKRLDSKCNSPKGNYMYMVWTKNSKEKCEVKRWNTVKGLIKTNYLSVRKAS